MTLLLYSNRKHFMRLSLRQKLSFAKFISLNGNNLSLSISKTKVVIFDFKISNTANDCLNLAGTPASPSSNTKFLETIINKKLSWNDHILNISKK